MPSELPPQQTNFGSEYLTWRETKSHVYCKGEDASLIKLLRWNDISTTHSVQWWTPIPHGFGAFIDVRAGSLLVMVAASPHTHKSLFHPVYLSLPAFYMPKFHRTIVPHALDVEPEAILLTEGMRM